MPIVMPETPTISIAEAAALLGVSRSTAHRMADSGEIPTIPLHNVRARRVLTAAFLAKFGLVAAP